LFHPVVTYLIFNSADLISRQLAELISRPHKGPLLYILVLLRVIFITLFLLCNTNIDFVPYYFNHDACYITLMAFFSLSNGYLSALCFMKALKMVVSEDAEKAGMIMAGSHVFGLLMGTACIFVLGGLPYLLAT